jgi:hypothetical protein
MKDIRNIHKKNITAEDIEFIQRIIEENPTWHRSRVSTEICRIWNWQGYNGEYKDIACRAMLRKLESKGMIILPRARNKSRTGSQKSRIETNQISVIFNEEESTAEQCQIEKIKPIGIELAHTGREKEIFSSMLSKYHYLGYKQHVGEHMKYLIIDKERKPISCLLFGSAAWTITDRDKYIGWGSEIRRKNLHYVTNNMRFLILPWIRIKNLASHILSQINGRIVEDWIERYKHPIYLIETFVESERYKGTCYKASNWIKVGQTKGRTRNDRYSKIKAPIKDIYLYPLVKNFKELLNKGEEI